MPAFEKPYEHGGAKIAGATVTSNATSTTFFLKRDPSWILEEQRWAPVCASAPDRFDTEKRTIATNADLTRTKVKPPKNPQKAR
jgi:hypothetical protein